MLHICQIKSKKAMEFYWPHSYILYDRNLPNIPILDQWALTQSSIHSLEELIKEALILQTVTNVSL